MERWLKIIRKPVSSLTRLEMIFDLIRDISSLYDLMFYVEYDYEIVMRTDFNKYVPVHYGGSIVKMPQQNALNEEDQLLNSIAEDQKNFALVYGLLRYINDNLNKEERAVISSKYLDNTRKKVMINLHVTKYRYYKILEEAQEKLIELWRLDMYGDLSEAGVLLDSLVVRKRRTDRTGLIGGYFDNNSDWQMKYYRSKPDR